MVAHTPCLFQVLQEHIPHAHVHVLLHVVGCFQLISHIKIETYRLYISISVETAKSRIKF